LDDLCGNYPRKRQNQLLCALNGEYAAGDIVQSQFFLRGFVFRVLNRRPISWTTDLLSSKKIGSVPTEKIVFRIGGNGSAPTVSSVQFKLERENRISRGLLPSLDSGNFRSPVSI